MFPSEVNPATDSVARDYATTAPAEPLYEVTR